MEVRKDFIQLTDKLYVREDQIVWVEYEFTGEDTGALTIGIVGLTPVKLAGISGYEMWERHFKNRIVPRS